MGCSDIHGVSTDNIDQSGFNPEFTCSADYGFKCNQKAPCHPCPLIRARLWCSCDQVREEISVTTPALTTTPIPNPIKCHDFHDKIWSAVTCSNACWRVSYFDFKLGNVRNDYGCMDDTFCDSVYQREQCYRNGSVDDTRKPRVLILAKTTQITGRTRWTQDEYAFNVANQIFAMPSNLPKLK